MDICDLSLGLNARINVRTNVLYLLFRFNLFADSKEVHVKAGENTETVKPSLVFPLQPGIWTVKIMYLWEASVIYFSQSLQMVYVFKVDHTFKVS